MPLGANVNENLANKLVEILQLLIVLVWAFIYVLGAFKQALQTTHIS